MVRRPRSLVLLSLLTVALALVGGLASVTLAVPAAAGTTGATVTAPAPGTYVALSPFRALDTRVAVGVPTRTALPSGGVVPVDLAGRGGLPTAGIGAVVATLTVTETRSDGYLVAWASDADVPQTSSLNWTTGQTVANTAVIPVGDDGRLLLQNRSGGSTQVVLDVAGYYAAGKPATAGAFTPAAPTRVLDTRKAVGVPTTTPLAPGSTTSVKLGGRGGPAAGAGSVVLNLTAVGGTSGGYVGLGGPTALPSGGSVLTWAGSRPVASLVVAPLAADGTITLYVGSPGSVHLVADLVGTFSVGALTDAGTTRVDRPYRQLDTREAGTGGALAPGVPRTVTPTAGPLGYAPGDVSAVVVTLTVTNTKAPGYLTGYASGGTRPTASLLNWLPGQTVSATVVLPVGSDGRFVLVNGSKGATDVVVDLGGTVLAQALPVASRWTATTLPGSTVGSAQPYPIDASCADDGPCALSTRSNDPVQGTVSGALWRVDSGTWSAPTTVQTFGYGTFRGSVACSSSGLCVALVPRTGGYLDQLTTSTPGSAWSTTPAPQPDAGSAIDLRSVTCPRGGRTCWAVGFSYSTTLTTPYAAVDDGTGWRAVTVPSVPGLQTSLRDVACGSDSACTAVGNGVTNGSSVPVVASWDGVSWSTRTTGLTSDPSGGLKAVAYRSTDVVALGSSTNGMQFALVLSGSDVTSTPLTDRALLGTDLACERNNPQCYVERGPLVAPTVPDGLVSVPGNVPVPLVGSPITTAGTPLSVSCDDGVGCVAVGTMADQVVGDRGVVQEESASAWTSALLPVPADAAEGTLAGPVTHVVACSSAECIVVSPYLNHSGQGLSVATRPTAG